MPEFSGSARHPGFWLAVGLPWPDDAQGGIAECARLTAPVVINMSMLRPDTQAIYALAEHFAVQFDCRVVRVAELTRWLDQHGQTWASRGIHFDAAYAELISAPLPSLYFALDKKSHAVLCDASRDGVRIYYSDGVCQTTTDDQEELRHNLTSVVTIEWGPYIEPELAARAQSHR
ncbi:MAG: hypothetical protein K0U84_08800 [Actinomycetia bacterium]|nr:hypothetical protein [Actinomycetes bacterium]